MCLDLYLRHKAGNKLVSQCYCQWYLHINNNQNLYNYMSILKCLVIPYWPWQNWNMITTFLCSTIIIYDFEQPSYHILILLLMVTVRYAARTTQNVWTFFVWVSRNGKLWQLPEDLEYNNLGIYYLIWREILGLIGNFTWFEFTMFLWQLLLQCQNGVQVWKCWSSWSRTWTQLVTHEINSLLIVYSWNYLNWGFV